MSTPTRTFSILLTELEDGQIHDELSKAVQDIVAELETVSAGQGGKPTATLTVKLEFTRDSGVIEIKADYAVKNPKLKRIKSLFWPTKENHLTRDNPKQQKLPFRDVTESERETRSV